MNIQESTRFLCFISKKVSHDQSQKSIIYLYFYRPQDLILKVLDHSADVDLSESVNIQGHVSDAKASESDRTNSTELL